MTAAGTGRDAMAIAWIQSELQLAQGGNADPTPPLSESPLLCEFVRDGRALCLLAAALTAEGALGDEHTLPKKIVRSMHQLSTFHSLERIQFFIKWCRGAVRLEEQNIFTSVQLLDEANTDAVGACIDALRLRFRPKFEIPGTTTKLSAFLSQFPPDPAVVVAAERPPSTSKRHFFPVNDAVKDDDSAAASAPVVSRLRVPSAFSHGGGSASTNTSPTKDDTESPSTASTSSSSAPKSVSKLEIPLVFGRQRSLSNADDGAATASSSASAPTVTSTTADEPSDAATAAALGPPKSARSISKLNIPAAFSSSTSAQPPSPKTTVPASPRSAARLEIPSAFTKGFTTPTPSPQSSPKKSPRKQFEAPPSPSASATDKSTGSKLAFPTAFGRSQPSPKKAIVPDSPSKAVPAPAPRSFPSTTVSRAAPAVEKRASKLAAFLSTVEAANELTSTTSVSAPSTSEPERTSVSSDVATVEPTPVVVASPEPVNAAVAVEAVVTEDDTTDVEEEAQVESSTTVVVEEQAPPPSSQRSSKLLAFLAAVPTPAVSLHEQAEQEREDEASFASASQYREGDPIVDPSGDVVHEEIASPAKSPRKSRRSRSRSRSPTKSPKKSAARELFPEETPTAVADAAPVVAEEPQPVSSVSDAAFAALTEEKDRLASENEAVKAQLEGVESVVTTQSAKLDELKADLAALKEQLEKQRVEFDATQKTAQDSLRKELQASYTSKEAQHKAALDNARAQFAQEKSALVEQVRAAKAEADVRRAEVENLREALKEQEDLVRQAKDGEEAARYAAQMAFAARDEAQEELSRLQQ